MRYTVNHSIAIVEACAVLHNLSLDWNDIYVNPNYVPPQNPVVMEDDDIIINYDHIPYSI